MENLKSFHDTLENGSNALFQVDALLVVPAVAMQPNQNEIIKLVDFNHKLYDKTVPTFFMTSINTNKELNLRETRAFNSIRISNHINKFSERKLENRLF